MIYHIVTGDVAAKPLKEAISKETSMQGTIVVIKDVLSVGPLVKAEGQKFSELRGNFWNEVIGNDTNAVVVDDLERMLLAANELSKNEDAKIWLWMAPWPADICTYLWAMGYLGKYQGRLYVVNIAGLPFLDDSGKLFYPKSIGEISPKELIKARKLARTVTPGELDMDTDEWKRLMKENGGIRIHQAGKKINSKSEEHYDQQVMEFCTAQFQKASKVIYGAIAKYNIPTGDTYLGWRLRKLATSGKLELHGDTTKSIKDYEVRIFSGDTIN